MIFYNNDFFINHMTIDNFSKLTFNKTFKDFKNFLSDEAFLNFDKRITSEITNNSIDEKIMLSGIIRSELLHTYNKQVVDNFFNFYDPNSNKEKLSNIFKENDEITSKQLDGVKNKYFSNNEEEYTLDNCSIIQLTSFNEQIVFFIKKILQNWLINQNKELNEKKIFFPGKPEENLKITMIQDIFINEGLKKTFSINYKMDTPNYKINTEIVKKIHYNDLSILEFFNLNENYKKITEKNHEENKDKLQFYFGNVYFLINTQQAYIINDLKNLLLSIGINSFQIDELSDIDNKENYLTMSILQLFKLNLGYVKND